MAQRQLTRVTLPPPLGGTGIKALTNGRLVVSKGVNAFTLLPPTIRGDVVFTDGTSWRVRRGGRVLQVVYGYCNTEQTVTANNWTRIGPWIGNRITPKRTTSTVLMMACINIVKGGGATHTRLRALRNAAAIGNQFGYPAGYRNGMDGTLGVGTISFSVFDAPATVAQVTYNVDFFNYNDATNGVNTTIAQRAQEASTMILIELAQV